MFRFVIVTEAFDVKRRVRGYETPMRGADTFSESLFTVVRLEQFVPEDHPLRPIREWVNEALKDMSGLFTEMYAHESLGGRPSIAPEKPMRAMLLQVLYSVRSERQLMEQARYNLLFRWFIGLSIDEKAWDARVFSKNRERFIDSDAVVELFNRTVDTAQKKGWLSGELFSADGTLIQAWAGHKSFKRKDGGDGDGPKADFNGEPRTNDTHASSTDSDAQLETPNKSRSKTSFGNERTRETLGERSLVGVIQRPLNPSPRCGHHDALGEAVCANVTCDSYLRRMTVEGES